MICPWTLDPCRAKCPDDRTVSELGGEYILIHPVNCSFRKSNLPSGHWDDNHFQEAQNVSLEQV